MVEKKEDSRETKQIKIYLALVLGCCFGMFVISLFGDRGSDNPVCPLLQKGFTALPVLAAVITRRLTRDKTPWRISLKVWRRPKLWAFCAFAPGILIVLGAVLYFLVFPGEYSGSFYYGGLIELAGVESTAGQPIGNPLLFSVVTVLIAAAFIPIQLLELGEEIGWREYLLPKQIHRYGVHRAVLLNGTLWGIAHLPLIYYGFNYSPENPGAPFSNMVMMMVVCVVLGVILSYVMVISGNVMYPAIIHGVVNIIGEVPVYLSVSQKSGLLGPNPTGLLGMAGLLVLAVVLSARLGRIGRQGEVTLPPAS